MPTDGTMSGRKVTLSYWDGAAWVNISGYTMEVKPSASSRDYAECFIAFEDVPVIGTGPRKARMVDVTIVYTENSTHVAGDIFTDVIRPAHINDTNLPLRWNLQIVPGSQMYQTDLGFSRVIQCPDPEAIVESADCVKISFQVVTPEITVTAIV